MVIFPGLFGSHDGVKEHQEFSHAGNQSHFVGFTRIDEAEKERTDDWVASSSCESAHE